MLFFGEPFFAQKINFGISFLVRSQVLHFRKITLYGIDFDHISLTLLKFWMDSCHNFKVYIFNGL